MKKYILCAIILALGLSSASARAQAQTQVVQQPPASRLPAGESLEAKPKLMIEEMVFEAREVKPGSLVAHEFTFLNEGDASLEFTEIQTGCSCTLVDYDRVIAPGATGKIKLSVRVYREWAGRQVVRNTWVKTNDPLSPQVRLVMNVDVLPLDTAANTKGAAVAAPAGGN